MTAALICSQEDLQPELGRTVLWRTGVERHVATRVDPSEVALLGAGANAILRLPPGADWDERLVRLLDVPARREARLAVEFGVDTLGTGVGERLPAQALNLSRSGILIETSAELGVGDELELEFSLEGEALLTHGRVVRRGEPRLFGVQFGPLPQYAAVRIERFVGSPEA